MDVRCERCSTDYEFDDALVSGRGTTVKCTNCGHKFKIRRSDGDFSEDFWNIQTADGRTLVFTSLRELQRAIHTNQVAPVDLLSRGGLKQKPIGQIPELAPFFDARDPRKSVPPAPAVVAVPSVAPSASLAAASPMRARTNTRPDFPPAPSVLPPSTAPAEPVAVAPIIGPDVLGPLIASPESDPAAAVPPLRAGVSEAPPTEREPEREKPPDTQRLASPPTAEAFDLARIAEARLARESLTRTQRMEPRGGLLPDVPRYTPPPTFVIEPTPEPDVEPHVPSAATHGPSIPNPPSSMGPRRGVGGYIISVIVLAGVAILGIVWSKDHLGGVLAKPPAAVVNVDPRVAVLLTNGEKALGDENLDLAKESFDKASALAEKDPHVLLDVARLAAVRADVPWLKTRLLAPDAADEQRLAKDSLTELAATARRAADDALAVAPDDAAALRVRIDALRINGDRDGARALVTKVSASGSQPETAYVLAALDLAEAEPLWSTVLERLRLAASAEPGPGRARAALVYALARSGDVAGAKSEVDRLAAMPRQHPLLPQLRAFAARAVPSPTSDAPDAGPSPPRDAGRDGGGRARPEPSDRRDGRQLVQQGETARRRGDLPRAEALFSAALDRNPNDTEALNGLAAIAHAHHDLNGARASYKRVLSINPSYVPALVGLGDVELESGDRASAMKTYKDIVDRFPEGTYPARVKQRLGDGAGAAPSAPTSTAPTPSPSDTGGGG